MTLTGYDVSKYQTTTPASANYSFMFARATYGLKVDPMFATHIANAKKAGIVTGAYHFGYSTKVGTPEAQASLFVTTALARDAEVWALDLEGSASPMSQTEAKRFIAAVHTFGYKVGLYGSRSGFPFTLGQDFNWIADWDASTFPAKADIWQYRGSPLDLDKFEGTVEQLRALAAVTPEDPMQTFRFGPDATIGQLSVKTDAPHAYYALSDGKLHGPIDPAKFGTRLAFGPVTLTQPIADHPGLTGMPWYLVGTEAAFVLVKDANFGPLDLVAAEHERTRQQAIKAVEAI